MNILKWKLRCFALVLWWMPTCYAIHGPKRKQIDTHTCFVRLELRFVVAFYDRLHEWENTWNGVRSYHRNLLKKSQDRNAHTHILTVFNWAYLGKWNLWQWFLSVCLFMTNDFMAFLSVSSRFFPLNSICFMMIHCSLRISLERISDER